MFFPFFSPDEEKKDDDEDEDDNPSIKRHCPNEHGVRGVEKLRLATHIENSLKQVTSHGVERTLTAIEDVSKAHGISIDRDRYREMLSQFGGTTFVGVHLPTFLYSKFITIKNEYRSSFI